jgi:hypothetical protein
LDGYLNVRWHQEAEKFRLGDRGGHSPKKSSIVVVVVVVIIVVVVVVVVVVVSRRTLTKFSPLPFVYTFSVESFSCWHAITE